MQSGENETEARAGSGVLVPRGTPHTYWNPGSGRLRYLLIMTPNILSLIQGIHAMKERTLASLQQLYRKHDFDLLWPSSTGIVTLCKIKAYLPARLQLFVPKRVSSM